MKILAIYDNEGRTVDRYTIITNVTQLNAEGRDLMDSLSTSDTPDDVQFGISQWTTVDYSYPDDVTHLGKRIHFEQLPENIQRHVARRILTDDE